MENLSFPSPPFSSIYFHGGERETGEGENERKIEGRGRKLGIEGGRRGWGKGKRKGKEKRREKGV